MYDLQKKDEQNSHHDEQPKNEDESQEKSELHSDKPQDQVTVDGEQETSSELQGSNEDNDQQETDNLVANSDGEKQEGNQQNEIDLPRQDNQSRKDLENRQIDGKKPINVNTHKPNDTTGDAESHHKMVPY